MDWIPKYRRQDNTLDELEIQCQVVPIEVTFCYFDYVPINSYIYTLVHNTGTTRIPPGILVYYSSLSLGIPIL